MIANIVVWCALAFYLGYRIHKDEIAEQENKRIADEALRDLGEYIIKNPSSVKYL